MGIGMSEAVLRRLSLADVSDILIIEDANQTRPWSEQIIRDEIQGENRVYLAILHDEAIFGFGGVMVIGDEAHVTNLLIAPDQRRRGFARRILVGLIDSALEMGAKHLTLEVRSKNEAAMDLYRKFGLVPVGVRPGYYGDDDAIVMWAYGIDSDDFRTRIEDLR